MTTPDPAQIDALSNAMSTMPGLNNGPRSVVSAPARRLWAKELIEKWGVSIDTSKATVEVVSTGPSAFGPHGPREVHDKADLTNKAAEFAAVNRYINDKGPAFLQANKPDLADRMRAAKTPEQRAALQAELREKLAADPNSLIWQVLKLIEGQEDPAAGGS